ncbi:Alpha/Beta hydrolase protein [Aspergillus caelatus]|uniref:Alpha/Beta hydrolase protein n=1 Tax=Aspergillus caelatus TaxID=61420 RepID=A0A5N7AE22_9EURO|nr:Alpha/Beta hydrolase protein [Aspergillus caelatus]KAE8366880.1 Alpha/Beta hydrolase protein [Aspergillus caelatus]
MKFLEVHCFWTRQGYIVVRTDERGSGQSPGELDTMSRGTIEWCGEQEWSSGKVGLLGISSFAGTQWRVAARQPKGLAVIIPWEDMSDYYRDRVRHGGILSDRFIDFWWKKRPSRQWGDGTLEGDLDEQTLFSNRRDQTKDTAAHRFMDEDYYNTRDFDLSNIQVPLLSSSTLSGSGGILVHLLGNVIGWMCASCSYKFLRFIVGRHLSFLDAFLKDNDYDGWKFGQQPRVHPCLRKGDWGVDDLEHELKTPITFLHKTSSTLEITGHILARLTVSCSRENPDSSPLSDIDLFITLRRLSADGNEVFHTDTMDDPVPILKGWLRVSLRKVNTKHPFHRHYLPYRDYTRADVQLVKDNGKYQVDVETLVLELVGRDTQGVGKFSHEHPDDRDPAVFGGLNHLEVGQGSGYLLLPLIPS